jgi:membrane protein YqaA with SNARE-associated domain
VIESLQGDLGLYGATLVICFIGGLVPIVNCEIYLAVATTQWMTSQAQVPAVVLLASTGQMAAKLLLYLTAAGALKLPTGRYQAKLEKVRDRIERWRSKPKWILFASAVFSVPPFYVMSLLAGAFGIRLAAFLAIGFVGRVIHFAAIVVGLSWL